MDVGRTAEGAEVRQVRFVSMEGRVKDDVLVCGQRSVAYVDHGETGVAAETVMKACRDQETLCSVGEGPPLAFDASKLPVSVGYDAINDDVSRSADVLEGRAEEDCVVADPDAARLVSKGCDGGEDLLLHGGCIGIVS